MLCVHSWNTMYAAQAESLATEQIRETCGSELIQIHRRVREVPEARDVGEGEAGEQEHGLFTMLP